MRRGEHGAVTAEIALGLPLLGALTVGLVWLLSAGTAQVRAVDAARETARAVARGDAVADAVEVGERIAPTSARVAVAHEGGHVRVRVTARVRGPGGLFASLPAVPIDAEAVAVLEGAP
ncbi:TadE family type IV pilus minor pilin [Nocardioides jishulii]|uniref:Pilus assembly protein n=1 Tax=Nocardioides jishulii TaxID=2575440 RepID=A0A4U2YS43_9ACTN|nr:TadE family type IV pilus minor pilin [Nocardioides jishulii]QCX28778.1 pilus assembly protein [Nocardioides jishulii]TKI64326.1 pilus assembly protein [Nocardioides jishulii]